MPNSRSYERVYEEYAYILDFLPFPLPTTSSRLKWRGPIAQAIGEDYFTLLELAPRPGITLNIGERVFIGRGERDKIIKVLRKINFDELTTTAKNELSRIIDTIVTRNEHKFVKFFNEAPPLTTRLHSLELLRGIGKKLLWEILREREKKPFENFEDIRARTRISDPKKAIIERILEELENNEKYYLFVKWKRSFR